MLGTDFAFQRLATSPQLSLNFPVIFSLWLSASFESIHGREFWEVAVPEGVSIKVEKYLLRSSLLYILGDLKKTLDWEGGRGSGYIERIQEEWGERNASEKTFTSSFLTSQWFLSAPSDSQ